MTEHEKSPLISELSWGRVEVETLGQTFKDAKLYPGGAREWDWNETGTRHRPGVQPADVQELLQHGAEQIVLARGMNKRLQVKEETVKHLQDAGVDVEVLETTEAVQRYNELASNGRPVGALIHSTC